MTSIILTAAQAALDAKRAALIASARGVLSGSDWQGLDTEALTVAHVDLAAGLVVLSDGSVHLGVYPAKPEVVVVTDVEGWTRGETVRSLVEVAMALPGDESGR